MSVLALCRFPSFSLPFFIRFWKSGSTQLVENEFQSPQNQTSSLAAAHANLASLTGGN